ncbi:MAG: S66 peptidase family protein [Candidatus Tyrphobacter sp.]
MSALPAFPARMRKPLALRRGERVGLIAPAAPVTDDEIVQSAARVRSLGVEPVVGRHAAARRGYLAGSDEERADDFNCMARDPSIRAIVALRGGYGTMRILEHVDYGAIAADPKIVLGFSDVTALLDAVAQRSAVITFHGPVAREEYFDEVARSYVERACMSLEPIGTLAALAATTVRGGSARGRIAGGNLSIVASLLGSPWAPALREALLLLEDVDEEPYRIDRMLTQLRLAGAIEAARGVIVGGLTRCEPKADSQGTAEEVVAERLSGWDRPVLCGIPSGHVPHQWVLPIGLEATLDADARTLTFSEPAVRA